jgi:Tol biopolymer transport system component
MTGFTYKRIRNYWLLYDELNTEYSFTAARDAIAFLKTDGPQHNQIYVLCNETGYTFKRVTDNLWVLYDPKINPDGKQSFRGTALGAIRFLKAMKEWLTQRGMLTYQKK